MTAKSERLVSCVGCHRPMRWRFTDRNATGLCRRCVAGTWRVVFDRDSSIGAIPENLVKKYGLRS